MKDQVDMGVGGFPSDWERGELWCSTDDCLPTSPPEVTPEPLLSPPKAKSRWRKVKRAQAWRPKDGEEIVGRYGGQQMRDGTYGPYSIAIVHTGEGAFYVTGVVIMDLINAANLTNEDIIKVVFLRAEENEATGHTCKIFELYKLEEDK